MYKQFGVAVGARVTKQSLGKVVPAVGIGIGAAFSWATLESIVDASPPRSAEIAGMYILALCILK